jgi:hypothetical protein
LQKEHDSYVLRVTLFGSGGCRIVWEGVLETWNAERWTDMHDEANRPIRPSYVTIRFQRPQKSITFRSLKFDQINPLNPELNPIRYLLALLGAHHFLHVSRIRVKLLTFMLLMSYINGAPILDVSRSHTTTQYSR